MKKLDHKDFVYIIIILVLVIVGIFTFSFGKKDSEIVSYLGFAGTLVGIILALVALIYAFYQSAIYGSTNDKLESSAKKIQEVTDSLDRTKELISEQLDESMSELKDGMQHSIQIVSQSFSEISAALQEQSEQNTYLMLSMERMQESLHETRYNDSSNEMIEVNAAEIPNANDLKDFVNRFVQFLNFSQCLMLYYLINIRKNNKIGNIYDLISWLIENKIAFNHENFLEADGKLKQPVFDQNAGIFWSMYFILASGGLIELDGNPSSTTVKNINIELEDEIINKVESLDRVAEIYSTFNILIDNAKDVHMD